jgi:Ca-activated chloride channel homolog
LIFVPAAMGTVALRRIWAVIAAAAFVAGAATADRVPPAFAQGPQPTFRAGVDLVTVRAVVRDRRGRTVTGLQQSDFQLLARGIAQPIATFDSDPGPVGLAVLFDISGSMELSTRAERAREASYFLLSQLRDGVDEAAIYAFDSQLHLVEPFTSNIGGLRGRLARLSPWGVTSLHDAIAATAQAIEADASRRRAIVVLTDGLDTSSRLSPAEVSRIASGIDVPVYLLTVVGSIDAHAERVRTARAQPDTGTLSDLARWTGGELFASSGSAESSTAARRIVEELRHQYLIAFEPSGVPGWHPLEVRVRHRDHTVQARSGYVAGPTRQAS